MAQQSAGILVYRLTDDSVEFFLAHPGGPFWSKKDDGAWSVPKGLLEEGEDHLSAAKREFQEETSVTIDGRFICLTPLKQKSGKIIHCWAVEGDLQPNDCKSNLFEMEWPKGSGKVQSFEEVDRFGFFAPLLALKKVHLGQAGFIQEVLNHLNMHVPSSTEIEHLEPQAAKPELAQGSLF